MLKKKYQPKHVDAMSVNATKASFCINVCSHVAMEISGLVPPQDTIVCITLGEAECFTNAANSL